MGHFYKESKNIVLEAIGGALIFRALCWWLLMGPYI